jgi:hypothetical protein
MGCNPNGHLAGADLSINMRHNILLHNTCILAAETRCLERVIMNHELRVSLCFCLIQYSTLEHVGYSHILINQSTLHYKTWVYDDERCSFKWQYALVPLDWHIHKLHMGMSHFSSNSVFNVIITCSLSSCWWSVILTPVSLQVTSCDTVNSTDFLKRKITESTHECDGWNMNMVPVK